MILIAREIASSSEMPDGFLGLDQRNLLHEVLCRWQQCVRLGGHKSLGSFDQFGQYVTLVHPIYDRKLDLAQTADGP
jgi:hypothetical protein